MKQVPSQQRGTTGIRPSYITVSTTAQIANIYRHRQHSQAKTFTVITHSPTFTHQRLLTNVYSDVRDISHLTNMIFTPMYQHLLRLGIGYHIQRHIMYILWTLTQQLNTGCQQHDNCHYYSTRLYYTRIEICFINHFMLLLHKIKDASKFLYLINRLDRADQCTVIFMFYFTITFYQTHNSCYYVLRLISSFHNPGYCSSIKQFEN